MLMRFVRLLGSSVSHSSHPCTQGKLKYNEHVTEGFDHMFDAFLELFTGSGHNTGKAVVKA